MFNDHARLPPARIALDIGSTVVKLAWLDDGGGLAEQRFYPRDFQAGIRRQVMALLAEHGINPDEQPVLACSSANGGLRVGIVCLSPLFSGAALRNQVLLAGANPEYVHAFDEARGDLRRVDLLLVGGGIDCEDAGPMAQRLAGFDIGRYPHGALVYAGNRHLAEAFHERHPQALVIANPQGDSLSNRVGSVFECVRRAYLADLVFKEGVSELPPSIAHRIRPTPEVASRGFLRAVLGQTGLPVVGNCLALDVGGATTDLHYTVELVAEDSAARPASGVSVARYVFADLGIVASRDTLLQQLRSHPQLYEFLVACHGNDVRGLYAGLREGEAEPTPALLAHACLFLALDRFARGHGPGLPTGQLDAVAQVLLTGGAGQLMEPPVVARLLALLQRPGTPAPRVQVDSRYEIWVAGITATEEVHA